jgi:hypothetical protein
LYKSRVDHAIGVLAERGDLLSIFGGKIVVVW